MPLWGATDADESKPKFLTDEQKKTCFATSSGWVLENGALTGNDNPNADPEILVAIGDLTTSLGSADITEIEFISTAFDQSAGGQIQVRVRFNEAVDVNVSGGTPSLAITNGNQGTGSGRGPHAAAYASGTGTNELVFSITIAAGQTTIVEDDVLVIGANALALNSGTIKDAGKSTNSTITNIEAIGTAAVSITAVA